MLQICFGLRPVFVVGMESSLNERTLSVGQKGAAFGIEMITLENGAIVKSIHGGLYKDSKFYSVYGNKGRMETARYSANAGDVSKIYVEYDQYPGGYNTAKREEYHVDAKNVKQEGFGHGGSDFWSMYNFIQKILGDENADTIDVYEALDMALPGIFAYRSILNGGIPEKIPNLRNKEEREKYRNSGTPTAKNADKT